MPLLVESLPKSGQGAWLEIRLDRLAANLKAIKRMTAGREVMAVIKANAYGHGLVEIARALEGEVSGLGVSSIYEVLELREHGIETPVFLFGRLFGPEIVTAIKNNVTLSVSGVEEATEISEIAQSLLKKVPVHVKIDTGMGRLGIRAEEALKAIEEMSIMPGIVLDGIYTHFATAERLDGFAEEQLRAFQRLLLQLEEKGIRFRLRHCSNSAGNVRMLNGMMNMVRPGLLMYGIYPDPSLKGHDCSPILSFKSRIILTKHIQPGDSVGYGRSFVSPRATNIATLPVGYSHGYPFHLSNNAWVLYKGKRYPLAGRVSMDYLTVDLGDTEAKAGDEVTLLGEDGDASITAEDLAAWAETIPYEIVTRLISRLPRFYRS